MKAAKKRSTSWPKSTLDAEEVERLKAELMKARPGTGDDYWEMHRAWCEEGAGKDDAASKACENWREHAAKTEL